MRSSAINVSKSNRRSFGCGRFAAFAQDDSFAALISKEKIQPSVACVNDWAQIVAVQDERTYYVYIVAASLRMTD